MGASLLLMVIGFTLECTVYSSRIFREERKQKMLPLLMILPHSFLRIAYEKIWAYCIALTPVCIGICAVILVAPNSLYYFLNQDFALFCYFFNSIRRVSAFIDLLFDPDPMGGSCICDWHYDPGGILCDTIPANHFSTIS